MLTSCSTTRVYHESFPANGEFTLQSQNFSPLNILLYSYVMPNKNSLEAVKKEQPSKVEIMGMMQIY